MAQYISVKRKQQTNKHAPLAFMLCLLFLFSSFTFSFADSLVELPIYSSGMSADNGILLNQSGSANNTSYASTKDDTFLFFLPNSNSPDTYYTIGMICSGSGISAYSNSYYNSSWHSWTSINTNNQQYDSEYGFYFLTLGAAQISIANSSIPYYQTSKAAIEATFNSLSGGGSGGVTNNGNAIIVVNPGNVAYIGYDSATFNFLINLSKPVSSLNSNARYGFATELPDGVITFTPSSGNSLPLRKSVPDLLGRSATWVGSVDTDTVGYFIVYNPVYDLNGNTNPPIRVTVTVGYINVTQFPLTASDVGGDIISTGNSDNFYISDGVQGGTDLPSYIYSQTDQNGNVTTSSALTVPVTPYNYTTQSAGTAESGLQGFIQQILDLLSAPIKLITNLYNSAVGFFNYLSSLWSWLPPELTTIIVSALGVLVVIGVIKFLWK